jgi:hypothetical protein
VRGEVRRTHRDEHIEAEDDDHDQVDSHEEAAGDGSVGGVQALERWLDAEHSLDEVVEDIGFEVHLATTIQTTRGSAMASLCGGKALGPNGGCIPRSARKSGW